MTRLQPTAVARSAEPEQAEIVALKSLLYELASERFLQL